MHTQFFGFTPDQLEKILCQHMEASARRPLMKRLITGMLWRK